MNFPRMQRPGLIPPAVWNALEAFLISLRIISSADIGFTRTSLGTSLFLRKRGGGGTALGLFQLIATIDPLASPSGNKRIRVTRSTIDGEAPDAWSGHTWNEADDPPYLLDPTGTEAGFVFAHIVVDQAEGSGEVTDRTIEFAAEIPEGSNTDYYAEIGTYTFVDNVITVQNSAYGPISVSVCPNWAAATEPFYGVSITTSPA
jgi:hypothetical protein